MSTGAGIGTMGGEDEDRRVSTSRCSGVGCSNQRNTRGGLPWAGKGPQYRRRIERTQPGTSAVPTNPQARPHDAANDGLADRTDIAWGRSSPSRDDTAGRLR